jgi:hypothetical protein
MGGRGKLDLGIVRLERETSLLAVDVDADVQFIQLRCAK